jgi:hypothetical protein
MSLIRRQRTRVAPMTIRALVGARAAMSARWAAATAVLIPYAGGIVWLTWPLAAYLGSRLPNTSIACRSDTLHTAWILAYQSHALATDPARFLDANIYHPAQGTLLYGGPCFAALPYYLPLFLATNNPAFALNVLLLGCIVLTAWSLYMVVERWTASRLAGFVAGWTYLTNAYLVWHFLPFTPGYAVLQYFPWIVYLAAKPADRFATAAKLVPLVVLQCLANEVYVAPAVLVPLGVLAFWRMVYPGARAAGMRLLGVLAISGMALLPVYVGYLTTLGEARGTVWPHRQEVFPGLVKVAGIQEFPLHLPWGLVGQSSPTQFSAVVWLLLIAGGLCVAVGPPTTAAMREGWRHGAFWAVAGVAISRTAVSVGESEPVVLPHFQLVGWLFPEVFEVIRVPARLGLATIMGTTILAGMAFAGCADRLAGLCRRPMLAGAARVLLATVVAVLMCREYRRHVRTPTYAVIPAISGDSPIIRMLKQPGGPLLELPVGSQGVEAIPNAIAMYRSTFHWRRLVNGYGSYWPPGFAERMALAKQLPDPRALEAIRRETGLEAILVHVRDLPVGIRDVWLALAHAGGRQGLELRARDGEDLLLFEVK